MARKRPRNAPLTPKALAIEAPEPEPTEVFAGPVVTSYFVAGEKRPATKTTVHPVKQLVNGALVPGFEIRVEVTGASLQRHAFAPPMAGTLVKKPSVPDANHPLTAPKRPAHLPFVPKPPVVPRPKRWRGPRRQTRKYTTFFYPESRSIYNTTAYPWSAIGQCNSGNKFTGVLVGPRHVLTCSHAINWAAPDGYDANWFIFTPDTYEGSTPFGCSYGVHIYYLRRIGYDPRQLDDVQFDYVVVVLKDAIGEAAGWFGVRAYDNAWDNKPDWLHAGYPLTGTYLGTHPTYEDKVSLDGDNTNPDEHKAIFHKADAEVGQSGGPMFGYWAGEAGPRVVGVQSRGGPSENDASGGSDLVDLVVQAKTDYL